jgi:hypothetical protein
MKRIIFSMLMLSMASFTFAQFDLGVKAGYNSSLNIGNLSSISEYDLGDVKNEMTNNFQGGVFARIFIKKFFIQPEVLYSMQKKEFNVTDYLLNGQKLSFTSLANISRVEVPVFVGYKLLDLKVANLRVFLGPKFIMNSNSSLEISNITGGNVTPGQVFDDFKEAQVDLEAGLGVDVLMLALDAKLNLMQDVAGKLKSIEDVSKIPVPTSNFVISLAWKLF